MIPVICGAHNITYCTPNKAVLYLCHSDVCIHKLYYELLQLHAYSESATLLLVQIIKISISSSTTVALAVYFDFTSFFILDFFSYFLQPGCFIPGAWRKDHYHVPIFLSVKLVSMHSYYIRMCMCLSVYPTPGY